MQAPFAVRCKLRGYTDRLIMGIDQDHLLRLGLVRHDVPRCKAVEPRRRPSQTESAVVIAQIR